MGVGEGCGSGKCQVHEENVTIGSALALGLTVFMCVCGFPMLIAGIVLVVIFDDILFTPLRNTGIALIVISLILLVVGLVFIIFICVGVLGNKSYTTHPGTVIYTNTTSGQPAVWSVAMSTNPQSGPSLQPTAVQPGYPPQPGYQPSGPHQPTPSVAPPPPPAQYYEGQSSPIKVEM